MLRLALPVLAGQTLNLLVGYTDWWLVGHYLPGAPYKAAMGLMAYTLWLLPNLFAAVAIGATALTARFVGAGDRAMALRVVNQAAVVGLGFAALATSAAMVLSEQFIALMQLESEAAELATIYLRIILLSVPLIMIQQVGAACLQGAGDTVSGSAVKVVVNLVNMALSASLVIGWGPFPDLGWRGLAIGTACGHGVGGLIILALLLRGRAGLKLRPVWMRPDLPLIRRVLRIGVPGGVDVMAILLCHFLYLAIINSLGTLQAAAHGLGIQIEALAYLPGSSFQVAAATLAGQYLGAADPLRARRGVLAALAAGGAIMTTAGLVFFFFGFELTTFFTGGEHDPAAPITSDLLKITALSMPSLAIAMTLTGALRGAGDTAWPLAFTFIGYALVRIPGACFLAWEEFSLPLADVTLTGLGWGVYGAWWAMVADTVVRSLLVLGRFLQGGWQRVEV